VKRFGVFFAVLTLLMSTSLVSADTNTITFEPPDYSPVAGVPPGSINGQDGWAGSNGVPILPAIDQAIVTNVPSAPPSFGTQSWRFSNAWQDGQFGLWPFSPSLTDEAGEFAAESDGMSGGTRQTHFEVQWSFTSADPSAEQVGLQMSTAPDRGDGARMSFIRLRDTSTGLAVDFVEYIDNEPYGSFTGDPLVPNDGCSDEDEFRQTLVATGLSRADAHTVKLTIDFVDGPRNDIVKVYVDGTLEHTGTTWEDFFRYCEGNPTRTVDSMIFQARGAVGVIGNLGKGFLIDNLSYVSSQPMTCNVIYGTSGDDTLEGTNKSDCIDGLGGNDTINGYNGRDVLLGGDGNDTISGGNGGDYIWGGADNDTMYGNNAGDDMDGEGGIDTLDGGRGMDTCIGEFLTNCES
jgi:Ca2+-binding RTX toxin-like protein